MKHVEFGTLVILAICSVIMFAIVLERFVALRKMRALARAFRGSLKPVLESGDKNAIRQACLDSKAPLASALASTWESPSELNPDQTQLLLRHGLDAVSERLRAFLSMLATLASTAPFIGLFGTVLGIMSTFSAIAQKGFGGPAVVSAGISQALIATAAGLAVAIPSVIFYNYFTRQANDTVKQTEAEATKILIMLGRL